MATWRYYLRLKKITHIPVHLHTVHKYIFTDNSASSQSWHGQTQSKSFKSKHICGKTMKNKVHATRNGCWHDILLHFTSKSCSYSYIIHAASLARRPLPSCNKVCRSMFDYMTLDLRNCYSHWAWHATERGATCPKKKALWLKCPKTLLENTLALGAQSTNWVDSACWKSLLLLTGFPTTAFQTLTISCSTCQILKVPRSSIDSASHLSTLANCTH